MALNILHEDHPKEYFYKMSSDGKKLFYKRTGEGHKKIRKTNIPVSFIDRIKEFDKDKDVDWMKHKRTIQKKMDKTKNTLPVDHKNYERSERIIQDRIKSANNSMKSIDKMHAKSNEERYKEEMRAFGGFDNYFREKYKNKEKEYVKPKKVESFVDVLKTEGIIEDLSTDKKEAKKRYRRWLVLNHPDKGGDNERCSEVINAYKEFTGE